MLSCMVPDTPDTLFEVKLRGISSVYNVTMHATDGVCCSCPDFVFHVSDRYTHKWCKHCCWLLMDAGECTDIRLFTGSNYDLVHAAFVRVMQGSLPPEAVAFDAVPDRCGQEECIVCYCPLGDVMDCVACPTCKKALHTDCITRWLQINRSCPCCRSNEWRHYHG